MREESGQRADKYVAPCVIASYSKEELADAIRPHCTVPDYGDPGCGGCGCGGCGCS